MNIVEGVNSMSDTHLSASELRTMMRELQSIMHRYNLTHLRADVERSNRSESGFAWVDFVPMRGAVQRYQTNFGAAP